MIHLRTLAGFLDPENWDIPPPRRSRRLEGSLVIKGYIVDAADRAAFELMSALAEHTAPLSARAGARLRRAAEAHAEGARRG